MNTRSDSQHYANAIFSAAEAEAPLEAWTPEDFDHFTDLGLLRAEWQDAEGSLA